jgi:hypothetical protein
MGRSIREEGRDMKSRFGEGDLAGRDVGLIGERPEAVSGYEHAGWKAVEAVLHDEYPSTNLGTIACAARAGMGSYGAHKDGMHMATHGSSREGHKNGKSGMVHVEHKGEGHPHHTRKMDVAEPMNFKKGGHAMKTMKCGGKYAAGGVGKERKGMY